MESWWRLGEGYGYRGSELEHYRITCPFCMEKGNFKLSNRNTKQKPNSNKALYFDTLECGNCKGYVMTLWSHGDGLYDYKVLPWPLGINSYPEHWPPEVGRFWMQARRNMAQENWDAAVVMARSALQAALRQCNAVGKTLHEEIEDLASKGELPPLMRDWARAVKQLGNNSAHPRAGEEPPSASDTRDIVKFLDFLLEYLFDLPERIKKHKEQSKPKAIKG